MRSSLVATLACTLLASAGVPAANAAVVDLPVTFEVQNVNRSKLSCRTNGDEVKLVGRVVGPEDVLAAPDRPAAVTLYLHEFSFGKWMWHFPDPEYDFVTKLAEQGHVSVIVDRLGYDQSPRPRGQEICLGGDADMAHQMVSQLR